MEKPPIIMGNEFYPLTWHYVWWAAEQPGVEAISRAVVALMLLGRENNE